MPKKQEKFIITAEFPDKSVHRQVAWGTRDARFAHKRAISMAQRMGGIVRIMRDDGSDAIEAIYPVSQETN